MSSVRARMIEDMTLAGLALGTQSGAAVPFAGELTFRAGTGLLRCRSEFATEPSRPWVDRHQLTCSASMTPRRQRAVRAFLGQTVAGRTVQTAWACVLT